MRKLESYGPTEWSNDLLEEISREKEDNNYAGIDKKTVDSWMETLSATRESAKRVIRRIIQ